MPLSRWASLAKHVGSRSSLSRLLQLPHSTRHFSLTHAMSVSLDTKKTDMSQPDSPKSAPIWMKYKERQIRRNEASRLANNGGEGFAARPEKKRRISGRSEGLKRRIELTLDGKCLDLMQQTLANAANHGGLRTNGDAPEQLDNLPIETERLRRWRGQRLDPAEAEQRSIELQTQLDVARPADKISLPMNHFANQVIETVAGNQYCTIVGETGSGKTTQVPQILLDEAIADGTGSAVNIICTQPRRIAATSVARRVASERGEELGQTIGYHIRHESALPRYGGSITYCTTGILLKQLQNPDDVLEGVSHIILDEVHERDINLDFTLILLKRSFIERARAGKPVPKLILMSATIDTAIFKNYFADSRLGPLAAQCAALHVPGRTFPVQRHYLSDTMDALKTAGHLAPLGKTQDKWIKSELSFTPQDDRESASKMPELTLFSTIIAHVVKTTKSGAILVFLPGLAEIKNIKTILMEEKPLGLDFGDAKKFQVYQLHSLIEEDQRTVFHESALGIRKIILSTNIAETSVTIPDVTVVIDSGRIRRTQYDSTRRISELRTIYVSQSNLNQRAGRAGRVQAGIYYGLFHKDRIDTLLPLPDPEMRLADLADLGLTIRSQQNPAPIAEFLADAVEPPPQKSVDAAVSDLIGLGAILHDETITNLGQVLANLPLHPALGKLVVLGILFECLDPIIILGTAAQSNVWERGTDETEQTAKNMRFRFAEGTFSEHLALLHAYRDLRAAVERNPGLDTYAWCRKHFLRPVAMHHIDQGASQVEQVLAEARLLPFVPVSGKYGKKKMFRRAFGPAHLNVNSRNESLLRAVLAAGLSPNMAWANFGKSGHVNSFDTPHASRLDHGNNWRSMLPLSEKPRRLLISTMPLMLFDQSVWTDKTKSTFLSTLTPVSPLVAALFGDRPREPSVEDKAWMGHSCKFQDLGNLVLGRDNRALTEERTRRLVMTVRSAAMQDQDQDQDEDNETRDALLRFREAIDRALDRVLRDLARGRAVDKDPEWRVFVDGLVRLVEADDWDGLEKARRILEESKGQRGKADGKRGHLSQQRSSIASRESVASALGLSGDEGGSEGMDMRVEDDTDDADLGEER